jgi:hypothetical protein
MVLSIDCAFDFRLLGLWGDLIQLKSPAGGVFGMPLVYGAVNWHSSSINE